MRIILADNVMSIVMEKGDDDKQFKLITPQSNFSAGCLTFDVITIPCRCKHCSVKGHIDVFTAVNQSSQRHILRGELNNQNTWQTIEATLPAGVYRIIFEYSSYIVESDSMIWLANVSVSSNNCTNPGGQ